MSSVFQRWENWKTASENDTSSAFVETARNSGVLSRGCCEPPPRSCTLARIPSSCGMRGKVSAVVTATATTGLSVRERVVSPRVIATPDCASTFGYDLIASTAVYAARAYTCTHLHARHVHSRIRAVSVCSQRAPDTSAHINSRTSVCAYIRARASQGEKKSNTA